MACEINDMVREEASSLKEKKHEKSSMETIFNNYSKILNVTNFQVKRSDILKIAKVYFCIPKIIVIDFYFNNLLSTLYKAQFYQRINILESLLRRSRTIPKGHRRHREHN